MIKELTFSGQGLASSPLYVDRIWLRVYSNKIHVPPYSIYLRGTIGVTWTSGCALGLVWHGNRDKP